MRNLYENGMLARTCMQVTNRRTKTIEKTASVGQTKLLNAQDCFALAFEKNGSSVLFEVALRRAWSWSDFQRSMMRPPGGALPVKTTHPAGDKLEVSIGACFGNFLGLCGVNCLRYLTQ